MTEMPIESINAVTLAVHDMSQSARLYTALGFFVRHGGEHAAFTSLHAGSCYLNLIAQPADRHWVGAGEPSRIRRRRKPLPEELNPACPRKRVRRSARS